MSSLRFLSSPYRFLALFTLAMLGFSSPRPSQGQSLHFAPVAYKVDSVDGTINTLVLNNPTSVAADAAGNLYIADTNNFVIRKVSPTQTASIFAGSGLFGSTGDGGQAAFATFQHPNALAVDAIGNVYVSDQTANVVRRINTAGVITTFAGNGNGASSTGDGGQATAATMVPGPLAADSLGNVYIVDYLNGTVRVVNKSGVISTYAGGGTLTGAVAEHVPANTVLLQPGAIAATSSGVLFIGNGARISQVDNSGNISTFAGNGVFGSTGDGSLAINAEIGGGTALAVDASGNVYLDGNLTIRKIDTSGIITTFAGVGGGSSPSDGVPADQLQMGFASSVAADGLGNVFIAVPSQDFVFRIVTHPEIFPQTKVGQTSAPQRIILESNSHNTITFSSFTVSGDYKVVINTLNDDSTCDVILPFTQSRTYCSLDVVFTPTAEGIRSFPFTVVSNDTPSTLIENLTSTGLGSALAMSSGQMFIVAGNHNGTGSEPNNDGDYGPALAASLNGAGGIAVDSAGNMFISDIAYCKIRRVDGATGIITPYAGADYPLCDSQFTSASAGDGGPAFAALLNGVGALTFDPAGNLYLTDNWDSRVRRIDANGIIETIAGTGVASGNTPTCSYSGDGNGGQFAGLCDPTAIASDKNGNIFIADTGNNVIRMVNKSTGVITTVAGNHGLGAGFSGDGGPATSAQLNTPMGVTVNSAGDIFISDTENDVIRKVTAATGLISTIAGKHGVQGYSGDGGLGTGVSVGTGSTLFQPRGLAIDAAGDVYIADIFNSVIRKIDTSGVITTVAGDALAIDAYNGSGFPATATFLNYPNDVYVASSGFVYVNDTNNAVIREMSPNGALLFPPTGVGGTSAAESVTLSNIGNTPLHFDPQFPTGITGDFAIASGGTCDFNAVMAVGGTCSVNITFSPTVEGTRNGIFGSFDDGVASPQYVALQGNGIVRKPQTINRFAPIPDMTYGDPPYTIAAAATSGLPVTYSVISGNASVTLNGSDINIKGVGPVTIAADQAGDATWLPAPQVQKSFNIGPGDLLIRPGSASSQIGQPIAPLTYTLTGFAYSDTASVVSGKPVLSTIAATTSPVGSYLIYVASTGTLSAANYVFGLGTGTYTVTAVPAGGGPPAVKTIVINTTMKLTKNPDGTYQMAFAVTNTGTVLAPNSVISYVKLNGVLALPNPLAFGSIPGNGGTEATVFTFPASVGASGTAAIEQVSGSYTGGTFGGTVHVTLP